MVVVGVKLLRRPRVERERWRWVGVTRPHLLKTTQTVGLRDVISLGTYVSTVKIQTTPVAAMKNASAH